MHLTLRQRASWTAHLFKAVTQQHHRELRGLFAPFLPAEGVAIDVGAHAGQFSKLFARMAPRGHVYAFEPSAYARSIMAPALALGGIKNVTLTPEGLSDSATTMTLRTPLKRSSALGFGVAHLGADGLDTAFIDQQVALTTLDRFVRRHAVGRVDLIKADVEGWEMRALKGGEDTLRRFRPALYLEIDEALLVRAGDTPGALFDWLESLGYVGHTTPEMAPIHRWTRPGDYLFARAEKP